MKTNNKGLEVLTTPEELAEVQAVGTARKPPIKLQYLKGSARMGCRLWNVLGQVEGYSPVGGINGYPTFSLETLIKKELI